MRALVLLMAAQLAGCVVVEDRAAWVQVSCFLADCSGLVEAVKDEDRRVLVTCIASRCSPK